MRCALPLVLAAGSAAGAPLSPLWRAEQVCPRFYADTADALVALDDARTHLLRIDRATGKPLARVGVKLRRDARLFAGVGAAVVALSGGELVALDATTGKRLWRREVPARQPWTPHAIDFAGDVAISYVDHPGARAGKTIVERIDPATGASRWRIELPYPSGYWLGAGETRLFFVDQVDLPAGGMQITAVALDPHDGRTLWTARSGSRLNSYAQTVAAGDALAFSIGTESVQLLDGATGKLTPIAMQVRALAGGPAGRVYALSDYDLVTFDATTGKQLWHASGPSETSLVATATDGVVYVHDQALIHELDATTGKRLAAFGIGDTPFVYPHATRPAFTFCDGKDLVALDPAAPPLAETELSLTGTLVCPECSEPHLEVLVGDAIGTTDDHGKFSIKVKARGKVGVSWRYANLWFYLRAIDPSEHVIDLGKLVVHPKDQGG